MSRIRAVFIESKRAGAGPGALRLSSTLNLQWVVTHLAYELVRVEIVPPGVDLAVSDLECPHDRKPERLVGQREGVHPLGHHNRTIGDDIDYTEIDTLDSWRARTDVRVDVVGDVLPAGDGRERHIVVDSVVGKERGQVIGSHVV